MFLDLVMGRKHQVRLTLTPQANDFLETLAQQTELSTTEVIEAIAVAQITLQAEQPQWHFQLHATDDHTQIVVASPTAPPPHGDEPETPREMQPTVPGAADPETIQRLQDENATLRSQLAQLKTQAQVHAQTTTERQSVTVPNTAPQANTATIDALKAQLATLKTAYAELEAQHQQQATETAHLRTSLAQAQQTAAIGEIHLNRWQQRTFSR